jgi:hypothetical protein
MLASCRERGQGAKIMLAAGLAAMALAAVLVAVVTARPLATRHVSRNLSDMKTLVSVYPDLAVSPDGDWVVAAWVEGCSDVAGCKGHVYLRAAVDASAAEESWGSKALVFSGGDPACAYDVAVAVTGTTAHVAYVVFNDTCGDPTQMQVRYRACSLSSLASAHCDGGEETVVSVDTLANKITWVDLAVDAGGNPHVVWAQYDQQGYFGEVLYSARDGSGWASEFTVASNAGGSSNNAPAIAWADDGVHVVWEERHRICYRRRGESGWEYPDCFFGPQTVYSAESPDVAAGTDRVFVVWDWCSDPDHDPDPEHNVPCSKYHLMYREWNSASDWGDIMEVGTNRSLDYWDSLGDYDSLDSAQDRDEYLLYLRPSVGLNHDGWPAVVWHASRSEGGGEEGEGGSESYVIYYSYAVSGTIDAKPDWITTTVLNEDQPSWLGSAAVGVGVGEGEQRLHVAYMGKPSKDSEDEWDVYYEGFSHNPHALIQADGLAMVGSTLTLDGSGSYDPQGFPLTYDWSLIGWPAGSVTTLSNSSAESPTLAVYVVGRYTVTLEVNNGLATSPLVPHTILVCDTVYSVYLPLVLRY